MCNENVAAAIGDRPETWLDALPTWQRTDIRELIASGATPESLVEKYLTVQSATTTAPFGGMGPSFYRAKFTEQVYLFLCSPDKYQAEREQWVKTAGLGKTSSVALLSESISQVLGAAPAFLAPAVAVTLMTVGSLGLNAWCAAQAELRAGDEGSAGQSGTPRGTDE